MKGRVVYPKWIKRQLDLIQSGMSTDLYLGIMHYTKCTYIGNKINKPEKNDNF